MKLFLILTLALSANAWSSTEFNFTSSEFNLICDLNDEENPSYILQGYKKIFQSSDKLTIHVEQGKKYRRKGSLISETLTNGNVVNLKKLHVNVNNNWLFFQTTRPLRRSMSGHIPRNLLSVLIREDIEDIKGKDISFFNHKDNKRYMGLCEIAEE